MTSPSSSQRICRWGILGAANIAKKNWHAIHNSGNGTLVAVASRNAERGAAWVRENQSLVAFEPAPRVCSYEELLSSRDIDAVYIPLPTGIRKEWVIKAASAGKHVLCEKPCATNAADLAEMIEACHQHNVQFMDGVMFMHSARLPKLRSILDDGESIGTIRRIASHFSFNAPEEFHQANIRVSSELEPLGALGDLGWYTIRFALWAMNYEMPERVSGRMLQANAAGVPLQFSGELFFPSGVSASFYNSFVTENQQWASVSGNKGYATLRDFVLPFFGSEAAFEVTRSHFEVNGLHFNMESRTQRIAANEYSNNMPNSQETNLLRNFAALVLAGKPDPQWAEIALRTQQVMDACLRSAREEGALVTVQ
jgi:predicted dehydrogenase